jgi:O-antigen ligase
MIRHSGLLLTVLLTALLVWAPLPFGGVTPWAVASLEVACFLVLALAAATAGVAGPAALRPAVLPAAALAAVALFALAQSLPWPSALVSLLSPQHAELQRQAASLPGIPPVASALSLAPAASRSAALLWAAAAAVLLAGTAAGRRRAHRRWLAAAVVAGGMFQVFFGAREQYRHALTLWGVEIPRSPRLHGTFVNPNHLALYLEIGLAVTFAWGWWAARRTRDERQIERRILLLAVPVLVWLILLAGLALTGSRGGLLGVIAGVTAQSVLAAGVRRRWRRAFLGLGTAAAGIALVTASLGLREGLGRFIDARAGDVSFGSRLTEYAAVVRLWRRFPWLGAGLGSFPDAFPLVQPAELQGTWWHAHSDVLELLATAGLLGVLLAVVAGAALFLRALAILRSHGRSEDRAAALAFLGVLGALAVHEMLDFGLTMPANALTVAVLAGAVLGTELRARAVSAEPGLAEGHGAAADALGLEEVEARAQHQVEAHRRARRKRSQQRSIQP